MSDSVVLCTPSPQTVYRICPGETIGTLIWPNVSVINLCSSYPKNKQMCLFQRTSTIGKAHLDRWAPVTYNRQNASSEETKYHQYNWTNNRGHVSFYPEFFFLVDVHTTVALIMMVVRTMAHQRMMEWDFRIVKFGYKKNCYYFATSSTSMMQQYKWLLFNDEWVNIIYCIWIRNPICIHTPIYPAPFRHNKGSHQQNIDWLIVISSKS